MVVLWSWSCSGPGRALVLVVLWSCYTGSDPVTAQRTLQSSWLCLRIHTRGQLDPPEGLAFKGTRALSSIETPKIRPWVCRRLSVLRIFLWTVQTLVASESTPHELTLSNPCLFFVDGLIWIEHKNYSLDNLVVLFSAGMFQDVPLVRKTIPMETQAF